MTRIVDPTDERVPLSRTLAPRARELRGVAAPGGVAEARGDVQDAPREQRGARRVAGLALKRYRKPTFAKPAPDDLRRKIAEESDFVIEALAD